MVSTRVLLLVLPLMVAAGAPVWAQDSSSAVPPAVAGTPAAQPDFKIPDVAELGQAAPRPVQAVSAALGLGRQRLAPVAGNGTFGSRQVLASAPRDARAVAAALRSAGLVVMVREDLGAADLRASLKVLRERLQPGGIGLVYVTALAAQVHGQNPWLPREAPLDTAQAPAELAARLGLVGVPVSEMVDALLGTPESSRLLVLDAAYQHPALARLPKPGLAAQMLPPGMMALFSAALGTAQDLPAGPPPAATAATPGAEAATEPVTMAASPFTRALVAALGTPRITGADALRATRRALFDGNQGRVNSWLAGDNESRAELAEATLVDSMMPRTPEDIASEAVKQSSRRGGRAAGEQTVAEVLQRSVTQTPAPATGAGGEAGAPGSGRMVPQSAAASVPAAPASSLAGTVGSGLGTAATAAVSTVACVGAVAAGVAASTAVQGVIAAQVARTVAAVAATAGWTVDTAGSAAGSLAGNMVALATRMGTDSAATASAAAVGPAATAAAAPAAALARPAALAAAATAAATLPSAAGGLAAPQPGQAHAPAPAAATPALPATPQRLAPFSAPAAAPGRNPRAQAPPEWRTTRNPGGGERPVYTPRINNYGYAEGDTFTHQVTDTWKGEVTGSTTMAIEEVLGDGQLLANGAQMQMDAQGRLKSLRHADGSQSTFEPVQALWWSNPKRGESRDLLFTETFQRADASRGQTEWKGSTSVGRPREIETAAGAFEVLPIESSCWFRETLASGEQTRGRWSRTAWYSPKLGHPVAIDSEDSDSASKLLRRERFEQTHAQTARGTP